MKNILKILFLSLISAACTPTVQIRNLPQENGGHLQFGKDNTRNFFEPLNISDSLKLKWETTTYGSYNNSSVIAYDKYIITHDMSGYIQCFDKNDGKEIGSLNYNGTIFSTPVLYKSRMFFIVNNSEEKYSTAYYFDIKDGTIITKTEINGSFSNQILKNDKAFYAVSDKGSIYKFNFGGVLESVFDSGAEVLSTPALYKEKIYIASTKGEVMIFDYSQKRTTVKTTIEKGIYSGISISGGYVFTGDAAGNVYCMNSENLELKWKVNTGNKITALPVCSDKYVFVTNLSGTISCIEKESGKIIWKRNFGGAPIATPLLFGNMLIQPNLDSYLYLINPADGKLIKRIKTGGRMKLSPVYFDGLLIVGFDKGNIAAYEVSEAK